MRTLTVVFTLFFCLSASAGDGLEGLDAPDFRLQDQYGEWHELADYRGEWLVIFFYPRADTPGCTAEACNFRDNIYAFQAAGANVVGVSVDKVEDQKAFSEKYRLPFTLLSDSEGEVCGRYGVLTEWDSVEIASRESFLVDPEGKVVKHYTGVDPETHTQEVIEDLKHLQSEVRL